MEFIADFHIHSKYSRATSKSLDLENLYIAAQLKGICVIGTGDFTHPGWFAEIENKLEPAEPGLLKLKEAFAAPLLHRIPASCHAPVRFLLTAEISNIYKQDGQTRKNHNLIFLPDLAAVRQWNAALEKIGNIVSDGRPILGISAKRLLEILLDINRDGFLVPAHIWTPWFSLLGSKSGFDSLAHCFEELAPEIWAVETGLSSDPPMNWRVSELDRVTLISNSDAHSTQKLGREANLFNTELSFFAIKAALKNKTADEFSGTIEFYPEEGKYHLDGHRKCNVRLSPGETRSCEGRCPVCGKSLTYGVLHRVEELADRPPGFVAPKARSFYSLIPLHEILSEILNVGPTSQRVQRTCRTLQENLGSEFNILHYLDADQLDHSGVALLGEAVRRMRTGNVARIPGYDGEFGRIRVFDESERQRLLGQRVLFRVPDPETEQLSEAHPSAASAAQSRLQEAAPNPTDPTRLRAGFNPPDTDGAADLNSEQRRAAETRGAAALVVAGPGTGKTRTLTHRIAHLIVRRNVPARHILAITFTRKAAEEMRQRLAPLLGAGSTLPKIATFHGLCWSILKTVQNDPPLTVIDSLDQKRVLKRAAKVVEKKTGSTGQQRNRWIRQIVRARQKRRPADDPTASADADRLPGPALSIYRRYRNLLAIQNLCDYDDLIIRVVRRLETDPLLRSQYQKQYRHVLVDEYQDLNPDQFRLLTLLSPRGRNLFVIGDPDQSVYGFRGSDMSIFDDFNTHFKDARIFRLQRNYRSSQTILDAAQQVITAGPPRRGGRSRIYSGIYGIPRICILKSETAASEAVAIGRMIEKLVGGLGFYSMDFGKVDPDRDGRETGFADIAVLFRTRSQAALLLETFAKAGIPGRFNNKAHAAARGGRTLVLSALSVIEGHGSYLDFERYAKYAPCPVPPSVIEKFTDWGLQREFSLEEALTRIQRFPLDAVKKKDQLNVARLAAQIRTLRRQTRGMTPAEKIDAARAALHPVVDDDYPDFALELKELKALAQKCGADIDGFLSSAVLQSDTDFHDPGIEAVSLMTLHAAKGLEFPVVFIAGCEDGYLPIDARPGDSRDDAEERRLFYVGMTRARDALYLSYAGRRHIRGERLQRRPSPFLTDIEARLKAQAALGKNPHRSPAVRPEQLRLF